MFFKMHGVPFRNHSFVIHGGEPASRTSEREHIVVSWRAIALAILADMASAA